MSGFRDASVLGRLLMGIAALWVCSALAHGPMDHSVRVTLMGNGVELGVTLGPDLAERALTHGGAAPGQISELLASRGPSGSGPVSPESFSLLAGLRDSEGGLVPSRVFVMTDGLEYLFVAIYPGPIHGPLTFHARYLDGAEQARPGGIEVVDEATGQRIAAEPLDASRKSAALPLPPAPAAAANTPPAGALEQERPLTVTDESVPVSQGGGAASRRASFWWAGGLAAAGTALLIWRLRRGRSS